jgi:hypothetical protein
MDFKGLNEGGLELYSAKPDEVIRARIGTLAAHGTEAALSLPQPDSERLDRLSADEATRIVAGNVALISQVSSGLGNPGSALDTYHSGVRALMEGNEASVQKQAK